MSRPGERGQKVKFIHGSAGLGLAYCGTKIAPKNYSGAPDEVTCPKCRATMGLKPISHVDLTKEAKK